MQSTSTTKPESTSTEGKNFDFDRVSREIVALILSNGDGFPIRASAMRQYIKEILIRELQEQ